MFRSFLTALFAVLVFAMAACGEDEEEPASTGAVAGEEATPEPTPTGTATATATGTATATAPAEPPDTVVKVAVGEWYIKPEVGEAGAGTYKFDVLNEGAVEHEVEVVATDTAPDAFPVADGVADVDAVGEELGEVEDIAPGGEKSFSVKLDPGNYVLICNLVDHYEPGMYVGLKVE